MKYVKLFSKLIFICSIFVITSSAQRFRDDRIDKSKLSTEERVVRFAYKKLYIYALAGNLGDKKSRRQVPNNTTVANTLKFELRNFQFGSIDQIRQIQFNNLVTPYYGDVIDIGSEVSNVDNSIKKTRKTYFSLNARWKIGRFASLVDSKMTLGELINYVPLEYNGYETFASYDVTVSLEGKSRTYKALALFSRKRNQMPKFLDHVVSFGGKLNQVLQETRDPYGFEKQNGSNAQSKVVEYNTEMDETSNYQKNMELSNKNDNVFQKANYLKGNQVCLFAETAWAFNCSCVGLSQNTGVLDNYFAIDISPDDAFCIPMPEPTPFANGGGGISCPAYMAQTFDNRGNSNNKDHKNGEHQYSGLVKKLCFTNTGCQSFCEVKVFDANATDTGELDYLLNLWIHKGDTATIQGENSGMQGQNISCSGAVGGAFSSCLVSCSVTATFISPVFEAQVNGGNLWNDTINITNTCQ